MAGIGDSYWLAPFERDLVIQNLLRFGLIEYDNDRGLPLKSGRTTDIYINLREARGNPEALSFLSKTYANPIQRIGPKIFAEVPDSVSCLAGVLSVMMKMPYITIREQAKEGRVAKASVLGATNFGDKVCILDDVITNGASKIVPYWECKRMGLDVLPLIVLVDRNQGWQEVFKSQNIEMPVWAGMSLHDVRRYLIENGIMRRCNEYTEEKNPIILALDGKNWEEILPVIDELRTTGCILKVNDLLGYEGSKNLIPDLQVYGRVMADIKGHDILNTLKNHSDRLLENPPWAVTVHGSGGEEMIAKVVEVFKKTPTKVLVVTVLTSIDENTCEEIYNRKPLDQVKVLAAIAKRAGAHGLVCSPQEVKELKELYPDKIFVCPGVRSAGVDANEQERIGTPKAAMDDGADYLVMGRQVLAKPNPIMEVMRLLTEELGIM